MKPVISPWSEVKTIPNIFNRVKDIAINLHLPKESDIYNNIIYNIYNISSQVNGSIIYIPTEDNKDIQALAVVVLSLDGAFRPILFEQCVWINPEYSNLRNLITLIQTIEDIATKENVTSIWIGSFIDTPWSERYLRFLAKRGYKPLSTIYTKEM